MLIDNRGAIVVGNHGSCCLGKVVVVSVGTIMVREKGKERKEKEK